MPSNHLILCHPLLLLLLIFPSIKVFFNESVLCIRWPEYWSFSFHISPANEYSGLISFRIDWFDLLVVQGTLKSFLQHHSLKASILWCSVFYIVQLSHPYMTTGKTIALTRWTFVGTCSAFGKKNTLCYSCGHVREIRFGWKWQQFLCVYRTLQLTADACLLSFLLMQWLSRVDRVEESTHFSDGEAGTQHGSCLKSSHIAKKKLSWFSNPTFWPLRVPGCGSTLVQLCVFITSLRPPSDGHLNT